MRLIEYRLTTDLIELNQLLKVCGLADSGGAGGALVSEGNVQVDGRQELRKRCKIRPGQVVQLADVRITVQAGDPAEMAARAEAKAERERAKAAKAQAKVPANKGPWTARRGGKAGSKPGKPRRRRPAP